LKFPQWLVTPTVDDYVKATVRLADDHALRNQLRRELTGVDAVQTIFNGRPEIMGQMMLAALQDKGRVENRQD
jgi:hypothetical protein